MAIRRRGQYWFIDYRVEGRRIREKVGPSRRQAVQALAARKGEIAQGRFKLHEVKRSPRFEEVAQEYLTWAESNTRSGRRWRQLVGHLRRYFDGRTLREITPWLVERYKRDRALATVHGRPLRGTTINRELSCLRRLFNLAIQWGKAETNPVRGVKFFREDGGRERILSGEEIERLLATASPRLRPVIVLALNTGMRLGEIVGLAWEHVDLSQGVLRLTHTKSGKDRWIPMNGLVRETLRRLPRSGPYVFGGASGYCSVRTAWEGARDRAGLAGVRFHDLRHTAATQMVLAGVDLATVGEILGHSTIALTMRYTHPTPEAKRRAVGALEGLLSAGSGHKMGTTVLPALAGSPVTVR